jgi:UDP-N-acetylglucosamine--N-acetylmuramyl-(pentapeptide) pyrophosphoryl-undecaprenol N-acetylglucosamine transferase
MGGFTSAPPVLAAKTCGAQTFLHESNSVPGRANRLLSWVVNCAFVAFPSAAERLNHRKVAMPGTPVRPQFIPREAAQCRAALGLETDRPVVLVMGGSQGAQGINEMVLRAVPLFARMAPEVQWFHLTGPADTDRVRQAYAEWNLKAVVHPYWDEMDCALAAATAAISRAGASSLAELAAMRLPAVLVPYPAATDDHQWHNARAFEQSGAARLLAQARATPDELVRLVLELVRDQPVRAAIKEALARWHAPRAAEQIAEVMLTAAGIETAESRDGVFSS